MTNAPHRQSAIGAVCVAALLLVLTAGGATAGHKVTSKDIKDHTIRAKDIRSHAIGRAQIHDGAVGLSQLSSAVRTKLTAPTPSAPDPGALVYEKDIAGATWTTVGSAGNGYLSLKIPAPNVLTTQTLADYVPLVYVNTSDFGGPWAQVPYYTERHILVTATVAVGSLTLIRTQNDTPSTQSWFHAVRLVLLPKAEAQPLD